MARFRVFGALVLMLLFFIIPVCAVPDTPTMINHLDYHTSASTTVSWYTTPTQTGNYVRVGTTDGGTDILNDVWVPLVYSAGGQTGSSPSFTMVPQNTYYYIVTACDGVNCSAWSASKSFTFYNNPPSVPSINAHADYHTSASTTTTWSASTDSDGGDAITYRYDIGTTSGGVNIWNNVGTSLLYSAAFTMTPTNSYYWKVKACDNYAACSAYSSEDSFVFTNVPPSTPVTNTAGAGTTYHTGSSTTFTWSVSSDSDGDNMNYNWRVGTSSGTSNVASGNTGSGAPTTSTSWSYSPTSTYYYSTQACDTWSCSSWAADKTLTFTNSVPSVPSINAHADYHTSASTTSSWSASSDGNGDTITYYYNVGTSSGGINVYNNAATTSTSTASYTMTPQNSYYWKVKACDVYGCSAYSGEDSFVFTNSAPVMTGNAITPTTAYSTSTLTSTTHTATDAEGDTVTYSYLWYKDAVSTGITTVSISPPLTVGGVYKVLVTPNDGYESGTATYSNEVTIIVDTPGVPTSLSNTTSNFWVNYTWAAGEHTDTFNVSYNGTWTNGSATASIQKQVGAHGWGNISVYGFNTTNGILGNSTSSNTQVPNNPPVQASIGSKSVNENDWLNFSISSTDIDGDSLVYETNATKGTLNTTTGNFNWSVSLSDAGVYSWTFNTTDNYSEVDTETITVTVNNIDFSPPVPLIGTVTTGNFWINTTWSAGSGNVTDGYNSTNGTTWINNTNTYRNTTLSAHGWQNLTIYAYNSSYGNLSLTSLTNNTQVPNNPPVIGNISSTYSLETNDTLYIYPNSTDLDNDVPIFDRDFTNGTFYSNNGTLIWETDLNDTGTYNLYINVSDGNGSVSTKSFSIAIGSNTPSVVIDLANSTGNFWVNYSWEYGLNTDSFNISQNGTWGNATTNISINSTVEAHGWSNITIYGYNSTYDLLGISSSSNTQLANNAPAIDGNGSISSSSFTTAESGIITITNVSDLDNDTITSVFVGVTLVGGVEVTYPMSQTPNTTTWSYSYSTLTSGTYAVTHFFASDMYITSIKAVSIPFTVTTPTTTTTGGSGGGGGGTTIIETNTTITGDLILTPDRRDTGIIYTLIEGEQTATYRYIANRNIESCMVEPNDYATCEIVDGYIVLVTLTVNETTKAYDGVLTVTDSDNYVATSSLVVRVIKIWGAIPIPPVNVGALSDILTVFFETAGNLLIGIRTWFLGVVFIGFGIAVYKARTS